MSLTQPDLEEIQEQEPILEAAPPEMGDPLGPWRVCIVGFRRPHEVELFHYEEGALPAGQFRVRTLYAGFSAGTELTHFTVTDPCLHARWADNLKLFMPHGRAGRPGTFTGHLPGVPVVQ